MYWGLFEIRNGLPAAVGGEHLFKPEAIPAELLTGSADWMAAGNGLCYVDRFFPALRERLKYNLPELLPRAGPIATIAAAAFARQEWVTAEEVRPVYLRDKVTHH